MYSETLVAGPGRVYLVYQWTRYNPQEIEEDCHDACGTAADCNHNLMVFSDLGLGSRRRYVDSPFSICHTRVVLSSLLIMYGELFQARRWVKSDSGADWRPVLG